MKLERWTSGGSWRWQRVSGEWLRSLESNQRPDHLIGSRSMLGLDVSICASLVLYAVAPRGIKLKGGGIGKLRRIYDVRVNEINWDPELEWSKDGLSEI